MYHQRNVHSSHHTGIYECIIRESVDSLYRDGADAQYIQCLSKSHETQLRTRFKRKEVPSAYLRVILQPAKLTSFLKSIVEESQRQKCAVAKVPFSPVNHVNSRTVQVLTVILARIQCVSQRAGPAIRT